MQDRPSAVLVSDAASESDPIRDNAVRLFRYLSALAELRTKTVRDLASYEAAFWFSELPREKECCTPAWNEGEAIETEEWLRIGKPAKPPFPQPPTECEHWFNCSTLESLSPEPTLYDEIDNLRRSPCRTLPTPNLKRHHP